MHDLRKMVLHSQATQKLWMASRQDQSPAPSWHPHPEEQWKQAEVLAAEWGRGVDGQLAPCQAHQAPEAGAVSHFSHGKMTYWHRQRQATCCCLTPLLLQMGTHCCLTTSSEVQATSVLLEKRFG